MLKDCPECRQSVSDSAELCPHCGYRLIGREHLVFCRSCSKEVLPIVNPHDTISKYCPVCSKPITGLAGRKIFFSMGWI
ncbi:MAG: zinc ribbon domain-containing protein [Pirellula sp.]|nr:zinc ribbon domain-containing protein [Pirellula sp.]